MNRTDIAFAGDFIISIVKLVTILSPLFIFIEYLINGLSPVFWITTVFFALMPVNYFILKKDNQIFALNLFIVIITLGIYSIISVSDGLKSPSLATIFLLTLFYTLIYRQRGLIVSSISNSLFITILCLVNAFNGIPIVEHLSAYIIFLLIQLILSVIINLISLRYKIVTNEMQEKLSENEVLINYAVSGYATTTILYEIHDISPLIAEISHAYGYDLKVGTFDLFIKSIIGENGQNFLNDLEDFGQAKTVISLNRQDENINQNSISKEMHFECFAFLTKNLSYIFLFKDTTLDVQKKQQKQELQHIMLESQKIEVVQKITGAIAHDFNNILMVIIAQSELIRLDPEATDAIKTDISKIQESAHRASSFSNRLLSFSKISNFKPEKLSVNDYLYNNRKIFQKIANKKAEIGLDLNAINSEVMIDPLHLEQIILNLVINAIDASPIGSSIIISTHTLESSNLIGVYSNLTSETDDQYIQITVLNYGQIEDSIKDSIFDPFFTTKEHGTGLGLSIIQNILQQYSADIRFECHDDITKFSVILKLNNSVISEENIIPKTVHPTLITQKLSILVVDDESDLRLSLAKMLRLSFDVDVDTAESAEIADIKLYTKHFDLIISDILLEKMTGVDLYQKVRESDLTTKIILVSGYNQEIDKLNFNDSNLAYLHKPFSRSELVEVINTFDFIN